MNNGQIKKKWAEIVAKAWMDEKFKQELLANPSKILKEYGIETSGIDYQIVENTKSKCYFVLPAKPEGNLSEHDLKNIAAADNCVGDSFSGP